MKLQVEVYVYQSDKLTEEGTERGGGGKGE